MAQTIHGPNTLIRLPDRQLTRLENGVAEVTRRYACRTSVASTFRSQFAVGATLPGESGFTIKYKYIERKREDGFTEFQVTGVGVDPTSGDTTTGLKAQDDRTVQTFPSGLIRVDRTYVCPTASEATFRPILLKGNPPPQDDLAPSIDGLFIFPDPSENRRDDGFTEFRVSSYGRINTTGIVRQTSSAFDLGTTGVLGLGTSQYFAIAPLSIQELVTPYPFDVSKINLFSYKATRALIYAPGDPAYRNRIVPIEDDGRVRLQPFNSGIIFTPTIGNGSPQIETKNFGFWDEVTINYGF